ncbi:prevent-host-death protein [Ligilactobacillus ruminis]|uniref:prevent-host-death protein n=1 Tax=Ligilactobacillus ruminis TaxID=1623 RepID=UPI001CDBDA2F|nr:prevent-host-death protein [Ligilactobacillus ruminis]
MDYGQSAVLGLLVRNPAKISFEFTDKVPFFDDLSVTKTHFTDKPAFFGDLSVNFWPL